MFFKVNLKQLFLITALLAIPATRSIAQPRDLPPGSYQDDLIWAQGLSASFVNDIATVNVLIENKSGKDIFLARTRNTWIVVTSDSGQSTTCYSQGIKDTGEKSQESSAFSRLKPKGKITVSAVNCGGLNSAMTKNVSFNIDLLMWEKEKNSQLTISITSIPIKKIPTR